MTNTFLTSSKSNTDIVAIIKSSLLNNFTIFFQLVMLADDWGQIEIQQNIVNNKVNSITAFFGEFNKLENC